MHIRTTYASTVTSNRHPRARLMYPLCASATHRPLRVPPAAPARVHAPLASSAQVVPTWHPMPTIVAGHVTPYRATVAPVRGPRANATHNASCVPLRARSLPTSRNCYGHQHCHEPVMPVAASWPFAAHCRYHSLSAATYGRRPLPSLGCRQAAGTKKYNITIIFYYF